MIEMLDDTAADLVAGTLRDLSRRAQNVGGTNSNPEDRVEAYLTWVPDCVRMLQYTLPIEEIDRLISTRRYWAVIGMGSGSRRDVWRLVDVELAMRIDELNAEATALEAELSKWGGGRSHIAVLDTNVLMHQLDSLGRLAWNDVLDVRWTTPIVLAVPMIVIDELDNLKDRGTPDAKKLARLALVTLESWFPDPLEEHYLLAEEARWPDHSRVAMRIQLDSLRHTRLEVADAEIVVRALALRPFCTKVTVVTNDTNMLTRARGAALGARRPKIDVRSATEPIAGR
jgi:rRNA-processing protein FCF1